MKFHSKITIGVVLILIFFPISVLAEVSIEKVAGEYTSKKDLNGYIVLKLNPDQSAIIEDWVQGVRKNHGTWSIKGDEVIVRYRDIDQVLEYHERLRLLEYRSFKKLKGLTTSKNNKNTGLLDSIRVVDKSELNKLIQSGKIKVRNETKTKYINFFSVFIFIFFFSAIIGRKNPILSSIACIFVTAVTGYFLGEISYALPIYIVVGFLFCFLWSIFFRWLTLKGRMGQNDTKIKFLIGFSSGKGTRNTAIISQKNSRTLD